MTDDDTWAIDARGLEPLYLDDAGKLDTGNFAWLGHR